MKHTGNFELLEGDSRSAPLPICRAGAANEQPGTIAVEADAASTSAPQFNLAACSEGQREEARRSTSGIDRPNGANPQMGDAMPSSGVSFSGRSAWDPGMSLGERSSNGADDAAELSKQKSFFSRAAGWASRFNNDANAAKYIAKGSPPAPSNKPALGRGKLQRSLHISREPLGLPAVEPGIDPQTMESCNTIATKYGNPAVITGIKFDSADIVCEYNMSLHELQGFLSEDMTDHQVQWINVEGLSWDVISFLSLHYGLHPLAVEDVLTVPQRIKSDFYDDCLYICLLAAQLRDSDDEEPIGISSRKNMDETGKSHEESIRGQKIRPPDGDGPWGVYLEGQVHLQQCSMFLLKGKTLLTIWMYDSSFVTMPLLEQLLRPGTQIRRNEDASFLMYRVMDAIVDYMEPVAAEFDVILDIYEAMIRNGRPSSDSTLNIYGQQRELIQMHRLLTSPLLQMVTNLASLDKENTKLLSSLTTVYLNDMIDNIDTISDMLLGLSDECRDLINLTFNLNAQRQSVSTQTLTIVSVVFLPITFLAGVYGMNFSVIPELEWEYGYVYFWLMCFGITVLFVVILKHMGLFAHHTSMPQTLVKDIKWKKML